MSTNKWRRGKKEGNAKRGEEMEARETREARGDVLEDLEPRTYISRWEKEEARSRDVYRTR